jgi:hypothetical protein
MGLAQTGVGSGVRLISRLVLNAQRYDPPPRRPASTPGGKPKQGQRQPKLVARLADAGATGTVWPARVVAWYGQQRRPLALATGTARWHTDGFDPLPIRWVLIRDPKGRRSPYALFCTDPAVDVLTILAAYLQRWNVEVTFEAARAHLGFETPRQWTTRAVSRTTPCLLGLFRVVVLLAHAAPPDDLPTRHAAWYVKPEATFSDALAAVRRQRWASGSRRNAPAPPTTEPLANCPPPFLDFLVQTACYAT